MPVEFESTVGPPELFDLLVGSDNVEAPVRYLDHLHQAAKGVMRWWKGPSGLEVKQRRSRIYEISTFAIACRTISGFVIVMFR